MKPNELPLFKLFDRLRRQYDLPLGIDEYLEVLRLLQAGFRLSNRQELEQLCCTLWATSEAEADLVHQLFEQMWQELTPRTVDTGSSSSKSTASEPSKDLPPEKSPQKSLSSDSSPSRTPSLPTELLRLKKYLEDNHFYWTVKSFPCPNLLNSMIESHNHTD